MSKRESGNTLTACALLLALGACTGADGGPRSTEEDVGHLKLALSGGSVSGQTYRLRDGALEILGTSSAMFSTEDYLDQSAIQVDLPAGGYLVGLADGWRLERSNGESWEDVPARLISTNPQPFEVFDQQTTNVQLRFQAGNDVIELGNGRLVLSIFVEDGAQPPPPNPECFDACLEAEPLGCAFQEACQPICENLAGLVSVECQPIASQYTMCAASEPGSSYICTAEGYPVAAACEPFFTDTLVCLAGICTDDDGDGSCVESGDCDDGNPSVFPGNVETCDDMLDNDCNGLIDAEDPICSVPAGWTCGPQWYATGQPDDCDCGCGIPDPDCEDASSSVCDYCDQVGSCSEGIPCPDAIDPMNNAICF